MMKLPGHIKKKGELAGYERFREDKMFWAHLEPNHDSWIVRPVAYLLCRLRYRGSLC